MGNCCRYGDSGAPLSPDEAQILSDISAIVKPYLTSEGIEAIEEQGTSIIDFENENVTPLIENQECAYFWNTANSAVRDLAAADQLMQAHLAQGASPASADQLEADGVKVISYADAASTKLRSLTHPSTAQVTYIEALTPFIAADRSYGTAVVHYARQMGNFGEVQLSASAVAAAERTSARALPQAAQLPALSVFIVSAPQLPARTQTQTTQAQTTQPTTTAQAQAPASVYVRQVDALLAASSRTLRQVRAFVPSVSSRQVRVPEAIAEAQGFVVARKLTLETALRIAAPDGFANAQALLVQSLRLSVADDQALRTWVKAFESHGDAQTELNRVNEMGVATTAAKQKFLATYGPARQAATGLSPSTLPDSY